MKATIACHRASLFRRLLHRLARSIALVVVALAALATVFGGMGFGDELRAQTALSPAIDEDRIASHYGLDIWQTQQGLPSDAVLTIIQTSDGYIWVGTFNGLVRFDGSFFHVFNKANTPALISNSIIALFEDSRRALWIGVQEGGVVRYKDGVFTRFDEKNGLGNLIVRAFCEDSDGALLIGTNKGAYRLSENGVITEWLFNSACR
jgi:ligand-binding sensor domain-containing protein